MDGVLLNETETETPGIKPSDPLRIAILGASGYSGAELVRIMARHPRAQLAALGAQRQAGKRIEEVFPHLRDTPTPTLCKIEEIDWSQIDIAFCALPHGLTQDVVQSLPETLRVIDLSADFRLEDPDTYHRTYGRAHSAQDRQASAVYGLTEAYRPAIRASSLVACPGCYPTVSLLPLVPLLRAGLIEPDDLIIDAASGVSGAGREAKQGLLFAEIAGKYAPYAIGNHRHTPEIEQELSKAAGIAALVDFTPHLVPMARGILATIHVRLRKGIACTDLRAALAQKYQDEPFVRLLPEGVVPGTGAVLGSNRCDINVFAARTPGRAILFSAIDNLIKGASGQAVQNLNLMSGWPETLGLEDAPLFP